MSPEYIVLFGTRDSNTHVIGAIRNTNRMYKCVFPTLVEFDPAQVNILTLDPWPPVRLVSHSLANNPIKAEGGKAIAKALADPNCKVQNIKWVL